MLQTERILACKHMACFYKQMIKTQIKLGGNAKLTLIHREMTKVNICLEYACMKAHGMCAQ